jgi:hypothetical protein
MGNQYFIHLDIQAFFTHINRSRITRSIKRYTCYEQAREIAIESTVRQPEAPAVNYMLPFGFVQSPIIASLCLSQSNLGLYLSRLASQNDFIVSIYMDDIIVSSNDSSALNEKLTEITEAANKSGLPLNTKKQEGPSDNITAFNIKLTKGLLKITDQRLNELLQKYSTSPNANQRAGIHSYVTSVNPDQSTPFQDV